MLWGTAQFCTNPLFSAGALSLLVIDSTQLGPSQEMTCSWREPPCPRPCTNPRWQPAYSDWSMRGHKALAPLPPFRTFWGATLAPELPMLWLHHSSTSSSLWSCFLHSLQVLILRVLPKKPPAHKALCHALFSWEHSSWHFPKVTGQFSGVRTGTHVFWLWTFLSHLANFPHWFLLGSLSVTSIQGFWTSDLRDWVKVVRRNVPPAPGTPCRAMSLCRWNN